MKFNALNGEVFVADWEIILLASMAAPVYIGNNQFRDDVPLLSIFASKSL